MAQEDDDESQPLTLLTVRDHEAFLIQQIPPKAKSSMVLCEQWEFRSPKDNPKIVIPIEIEVVDKYDKGLWMYLKRTNANTKKKEVYLHFQIDRDLPTVEQAYDSSRYYQLSIPKPNGGPNEMIYMGLRDDSKQLQDELSSYWRAQDNKKEIKAMPEQDWSLDDNAQITIGKGANSKGGGGGSEKKEDSNGNKNVMPLAAPGGGLGKPKKSKKSKHKGKDKDKDKDDPNSSSNPKNKPKQSVFDDSFGNDFDSAFGNVQSSNSNKNNNNNNDANNGNDKSNNDGNKDDANKGNTGWSDFDF